MDLDCATLAYGIHALVGLPLDVDLIGADGKHSGQRLHDRLLVGNDLRSFANNCAVKVSDSEPSGVHAADSFFKEQD